jgi:predicted DNA-binding ArsR family transcriptional regulator
MKRKLLTLGLSVSMVLALSVTTLSAEEEGKPLDEVPEKVEHTPYTTTRVSQATTLKKLAQLYYGDENDYVIIQKANKGLRMHVPRNTEVVIPITEKFKDQPEQLDWQP